MINIYAILSHYPTTIPYQISIFYNSPVMGLYVEGLGFIRIYMYSLIKLVHFRIKFRIIDQTSKYDLVS